MSETYTKKLYTLAIFFPSFAIRNIPFHLFPLLAFDYKLINPLSFLLFSLDYNNIDLVHVLTDLEVERTGASTK